MKTTATNRKIRELLTAVRNNTLIIKPAFQRRLVWKNKDKCNFLQTVLDEYPFPEIYVATGGVDLVSGEGTEVLVDGQQRVTTLSQYFYGSEDLKLGDQLPSYVDLPKEAKECFLQYDVVVRDLGHLHEEDIKKVFQRINSTSYSLNAMEIHNSRFDGEFKIAAEKIAESGLFAIHRVFSANEIRRMEDTRFVLGYMSTIMSTYFHRDSEIENFLEMYNETFKDSDKVHNETKGVMTFLEGCGFPASSRVWKHADVFTLLVETHRALEKDCLALDNKEVGQRLNDFYELVSSTKPDTEVATEVGTYRKAALQATNDRSNRLRRGKIIARILRG